MPAVRIVFAGTSSFAVPILQTIFDEGYVVPGVVTQPDRPAGRGQILQPPPVKIRAHALGLPVHQPQSLRNEDARSLVQDLSPDLLVVVAYGKILPAWLLSLPRFGAVNLHGSLLPRYRGAAPIQWAIANGDPETGVCTMKLDEGLDTGPVYECVRTPIDPNETVQTLSDRLSALGCDLMRHSLAGIIAGTLQPTPQDHAAATLAPILTKNDGIMDWGLSARTIHNRVRAFNPWPGTRTRFRDQVCRVLRSQLKDPVAGVDAPGEPGSIVVAETRGDRFVAVVCGDGGWLELLEVQLPNRKPQKGVDFVNGMRVEPGEKFANTA